MNPDRPLEPAKIYETIAHELVHEWLHLDGPAEEVRWFAEGAANYYSLVVPFRAGLLDEDAFVEAINREARTGYANPRRHLTLAQAEPLFFSDFFAHWLPYVRGMFYLADLDARLRAATAGGRSVDDVVVEVTRRRRDGEAIGPVEWCTVVDGTLPGSEREMLKSLVFDGSWPPGRATFGPRFEMIEGRAPTLDVGFDPLTFVTGRVTGLVPGGPAATAGSREGDTVELPSLSEALPLKEDDVVTIRVTGARDCDPITLPLDGRTVPVPQWQVARP